MHKRNEAPSSYPAHGSRRRYDNTDLSYNISAARLQLFRPSWAVGRLHKPSALADHLIKFCGDLITLLAATPRQRATGAANLLDMFPLSE